MMRKTSFALLLAALIPESVLAQGLAGRDKWADSASRVIEAATMAGDLAGLQTARALVERALTAYPNDPLLLHYQGYALYREAAQMQGMAGHREGVRAVLEAADSVLDRSGRRLNLPETHAIRSSVLGQLIGSNPLRGMTLGPRASSAMDRALELGPENPRVWLLRGIGAMFTPGMFGGGQDRAEEYLTKAVALFARDNPTPPAPSWGRADAYIWLGQLRHKQGRIADARKSYEIALGIQPDNQWVSSVLVPALDGDPR